MAVEGLAAGPRRPPSEAKAYSRTKLLLGITSSVLSFLFLAIVMVSGLSREIRTVIVSMITNPYAAVLAFAALLGIAQTLITAPLGFYSGYIIEHRYHLSNQTLGQWAWERLKGLLVGLPIAAGVLLFLFFCLQTYGATWWLPVAIVLTILSVVLARLAPVIIFPLFYTFTPLPEGQLRDRIMQLCLKAGLRIEGIFSFNLSKNTKKANAGFAGIGRSKRIILGDTLIKEFTEEEVETVFAHELGHYRHRHILIGVAVGILSTFLGLFITSRLYLRSLGILGFESLTDLAALPLLALWLSLFALVTSPLGNMLSRRHERQADMYAVNETGNRAAFVSALRKLAGMNLADPEPHPLVEFFFYSHPSINRRIRALEALRMP